MSDIKMIELLSLPVKREPGGAMPYLKDANGEVIFVGDGYHIDAIVIAVNTHDTLVAQNLALKAALAEILDKAGNMSCYITDDDANAEGDIMEIAQEVLRSMGDE